MTDKPSADEIAALKKLLADREAIKQAFPLDVIEPRLRELKELRDKKVDEFTSANELNIFGMNSWPEELKKEYFGLLRADDEERDLEKKSGLHEGKLLEPIEAYAAKARSNYFRVKDRSTYEAMIESVDWPLTVIEDKDDPELVGVYVATEILGGWPTPEAVPTSAGLELGEDFFDLVAAHLEDGEVALFQEVGGYCVNVERDQNVFAYGKPGEAFSISGFSLAINSAGERVRMDLDDIYEQARRLSQDKLKARPVAVASLEEYEEFTKQAPPQSGGS